MIKSSEQLTDEQVKKFIDFAFMDDLEYYEKYIADLPLKDQAIFFEKFPELISQSDDIGIYNTKL